METGIIKKTNYFSALMIFLSLYLFSFNATAADGDWATLLIPVWPSNYYDGNPEAVSDNGCVRGATQNCDYYTDDQINQDTCYLYNYNKYASCNMNNELQYSFEDCEGCTVPTLQEMPGDKTNGVSFAAGGGPQGSVAPLMFLLSGDPETGSKSYLYRINLLCHHDETTQEEICSAGSLGTIDITVGYDSSTTHPNRKYSFSIDFDNVNRDVCDAETEPYSGYFYMIRFDDTGSEYTMSTTDEDKWDLRKTEATKDLLGCII